MHTNSELLFSSHARHMFRPECQVLETGPGSFPSSFRKLISNEAAQWDTVDIFENPQLTYSNAEENMFPIPDYRYAVVLAAQVIEHVRRPWVWLKEVARVSKPGGHVVLVCPVSWPYNTAPLDCCRIYSDGMKALLENAGLKTIKCLFESQELPGYKQYTPGVSPECQSKLLRTFFRLAGPLWFPVERAYDTLATAAKK